MIPEKHEFEFAELALSLLGELLKIISEKGKGQLIFTSHNLRPRALRAVVIVPKRGGLGRQSGRGRLG